MMTPSSIHSEREDYGAILSNLQTRLGILEQSVERRRDMSDGVINQLQDIKVAISELRSDVKNNAVLAKQVFETHSEKIASIGAENVTIRGWIVGLVGAVITAMGTIIVHLVWGRN